LTTDVPALAVRPAKNPSTKTFAFTGAVIRPSALLTSVNGHAQTFCQDQDQDQDQEATFCSLEVPSQLVDLII